MSLWRSYLNTSKFDVLHSSVRRRVGELIERLDLRAVSRKQGRDLTYRDQKMLAIANALATNPKLLLLDEPMAGLTSKETQEAMEVIRWSRDQGVTVLLIEHDMRCVMELCERIVVLNHGEKICEGTPAEVRNSERVIETYLGAD
jgi:branched-chain amino acid transport system ATP-binding protein